MLGWVRFGSLLLGPSQLVIHQHLILSGDVELNPGPLDHGRVNVHVNSLPVFQREITLFNVEIEEILSKVDNTTFGR